MRHLVVILSLLIITSAFPCVAAAEDWEEYLAFRSRFYRLDDQEFSNITCNIEAPMLAEMIKQTRAQLEPLKDNIEIAEDLSGFSMSYGKSEGLTINRPELSVVVKSEEGLADPAQVKNGVKMMNSGFKQVIDGISMQLAGTLDEYVMPRRENFDMLEVANAKDGFTATYKRAGNNITETFSGNKLEINSSGAGGEMHSLQNYGKTGNDKLILKDASVTINQPMGKIESDILLTYQKVGSIIFPKSIVTKVRQEIQSVRQEGQTEINLNDCNVN